VKECSNVDVCEKATTFVSSTEKVWKDRRGAFSHFVAEARLRGLSCGVANDIRALNQCNYTKDKLKEIQVVLKEFAFYKGRIDGIMGPGTRSAFRRANNLLQRSNSKQPCLTAEHMSRLNLAQNILVGEVEQENGISLQGIIAENTELREALQKLRGKPDDGEWVSPSLGSNYNDGMASANGAISLQAAYDEQISKLRAKLESFERLEVKASELKRELEVKNEVIAELQQQVNELNSVLAGADNRGNASADTARQLSAANETIAEQYQKILSLSESSDRLQAEAERVPELRRQLAAANGTIADLRDDVENDRRVLEIKRALEAANETIADLRDSIAEDYVSVSRLTASNATIANLREQVSEEYVLRADYAELQRQLDGANKVLADLREEIDNSFVPLKRHKDRLETLKREKSELREQLNASLTTVADLRDEMETS
jgi:chromosome segregation ATPase